MTIAAGLSATKSGFDLIKGVREIIKRPEVDVGEVQARLLELQELMLQAQQALGDAEEENRGLRHKLDDREALAALEADLEFVQDGQFWIRKSDKVKNSFIPYCPVCWGEKKVFIPLREGNTKGCFSCIVHKSLYQTKACADALRRATSQIMQ